MIYFDKYSHIFHNLNNKEIKINEVYLYAFMLQWFLNTKNGYRG